MINLRRAQLAILLAPLASACIDDSERCGPNMMFQAAFDVCVCTENSVATATGCDACADDEVVVGTACACPMGQVKNDANVCATVAGLGDACADDMPCGDATYSYCAPSTAGSIAGTCTETCTSNDDCAPAFTCATWEPQPYCRAFTGVGMTCVTQEDCAGTDAPACDTVQTHACMIAGCSVDDNDCPRGTSCCDLSMYGAGTICLQACP